MGVGKKKVFTDSTKHQRYYAENKGKRLTQTHERRKKSRWENVFYAMEQTCKTHNKKSFIVYRLEVEFSMENFKTFYEANTKGMEHPQVHRLDAKKNFNATNVVFIERKWFPYIAGKTVEEKKKLIEGFKKGG